MPTHKLTGRDLKLKVLKLLGSKDLDQALDTLCQLPAQQVINPLFSFLLSTDPKAKWATVTAIGAVVANLAHKDMESARVIMRRLMWQLNDESGGIGWGCPETMGEIMACHENLAKEYANVLISYVREDGNYLEYESLQRGVAWGIARLAQVRHHLMRDATAHLLPFLEAQDATLRGRSAWALGLIRAHEAQSRIEGLAADVFEIEIYIDRKLRACRVMDLAKEALTRINQAHSPTPGKK